MEGIFMARNLCNVIAHSRLVSWSSSKYPFWADGRNRMLTIYVLVPDRLLKSARNCSYCNRALPDTKPGNCINVVNNEWIGRVWYKDLSSTECEFSCWDNTPVSIPRCVTSLGRPNILESKIKDGRNRCFEMDDSLRVLVLSHDWVTVVWLNSLAWRLSFSRCNCKSAHNLD